MMIEIFLLLMLLMLSIIDIKYKKLPSSLTTSIIFILALVNFNNLMFGVLMFIFAYMMMEGLTDKGEFFTGVADLKVTVMLGLMINNIYALMFLIFLILIIGVVYKIIMMKFLKQKNEIAFIPVFLIVYIILLVVQNLSGGIF